MKRKLLIFLCVLGLTLFTGASAFADLTLYFSADEGAQIQFNGLGAGNSTFSFTTGTNGSSFQVTSETGTSGNGSAVGLYGDINGTFLIGPVTVTTVGAPINQRFNSASVTNTDPGPWTFVIHDGSGFDLTGNVQWIDIQTSISTLGNPSGNQGTINTAVSANVTNITYGGSVNDLVYLASGDAASQVTFNPSPPKELTDLIVNGTTNTSSYSGSITAPIPPTALLLGGGLLGLVGLGWRRRRS
jgi:hypothetical protein